MKRGLGVMVGSGLAVAAVVAVHWSLPESGPPRARALALARRAAAAPRDQEPAADAPAPAPAPAPTSVQDALLRRVDLPFAEPTALVDVQKYLADTLGLAVVLDVAALDRLDIDPAEDAVQLNLKGARLKTGLKLLLDQLDLTYRVEPEDNLLILTDASQAGDPIERALRELKALHDELHDLRDAVDDLRDLVEEDLGVEDNAEPTGRLFVRHPRQHAARRRAAHAVGRTQPRPAVGPAR